MMTPDELFEANTKLVYYVYSKYFGSDTVHKDDLIQEGMIYLWRACQTYNPSRHVKFSTYATQVIHNRMNEYMAQQAKHSHNVSLDSIIMRDQEGNTRIMQDVLCTEDEYGNTDLRIIVKQSLNHMAERDRQIVILSCGGWTQNQVARMQKVSQSTVSKTLKKFRSHIKGELQNERE